MELSAVLVSSWRRLFASRKRLIVENYLANGAPPDADWDAIIESGRTHLRGECERHGTLRPAPADFDDLERRMASSMRLIAAWIIFWSAGLPAASLAAIIWWRGLTAISAVVLSLCSFPMLSLLGLFLQAPLVLVFVRVMNRRHRDVVRLGSFSQATTASGVGQRGNKITDSTD